MKILIAYASSDGQTRKIAQYVADHLFDAGQTCELIALADASEIDLGRFDRAILAASIHAGHYQSALIEFVTNRKSALEQVPTLFLSVSLAAAGHDAQDWKALDHIAGELTEATDWTPSKVAQVAGAYRPSRYDVFKRLIMRRIIAAKDPEADLQADKEYTDWTALVAAVDTWIAR